MSLSIQTNVTSLIAQENLNVNNHFQSKTIQQLTSGYRINQSGDDAAGLAVANKFRSSVAELTQGVANANDGVAQLQIMDGGMSNISMMLDRLKTLATQSASGTFTGDRGVLNSEFQTDVAEIDRQAQAIGLNTGGTFAKSLSVFLGGGTGATAAATLANGVVTVNLSTSTVDSKSLGLKGVQTINSTVYDLGASSSTSVPKILSNANNVASISGKGGLTQFTFNGPGFGDSSGVTVSVNLSGVASPSDLTTAINAGIASAAGLPTSAAAAFKAAGITASITTDAATGKQMLTFNSASSAFQVQGDDKMANALLGDFKSGAAPEGDDVGVTVTGNAGANGTLAAAQVLNLRVEGGGLAGPEDIQYTVLAGGETAAAVAAKLQGLVAADSNLQSAGITMTGTNAATGLVFSSSTGEQFQVSLTGDLANNLGMGSYLMGGGGGTSPEYSSLLAANTVNVTNTATVSLAFSFAGGASTKINITVATTDNTASLATKINAAIAADSTLSKTDLIATSPSNLQITSASGTMFRLSETSADATDTLGFYHANTLNSNSANGTTAFANAGTTFYSQVAGGSNELAALSAGVMTPTNLSFASMKFSTDAQTVTVTANDASGGQHSKVITLGNATNTAGQTGTSIDTAIHTINAALQASNDATLQNITAVKMLDTSEKINFISTNPDFQVSIGAAANGNGVGSAGMVKTANEVGTGNAIDITTESGAQAAVAAISAAVANLGASQASVGKGENQLGYAISLAQSQITNFSSAESQIRDADIAQQASNLTKAQVLQQASIAAMAQANSAPQAVLSLLKG